MDKKPNLCPLIDGIGLASLVVAIFALGGSVWFVESATQGNLLQTFQIAFGTSILAFLGARSLQLAEVIRNTPDPKSLRAAVENAEGSSLEPVPNNVVAGEIRRAA